MSVGIKCLAAVVVVVVVVVSLRVIFSILVDRILYVCVCVSNIFYSGTIPNQPVAILTSRF